MQVSSTWPNKQTYYMTQSSKWISMNTYNMNNTTEVVLAHATSQKHTDTFSCYTWATHCMVVPTPLYVWDN